MSECQDLDSMCQILWRQPESKHFFQEIQNAVFLEEMLRIGRSYISGPFKTFPPDVNRNLYSDIIRFSLKHTPQTLALLISLIVPMDKSVTTGDVVRVAHFIATFAHSVNRENNTLPKLKSVLLQKMGLTNDGLDSIMTAGITESSRSQRNSKDFFAGIANEVLKSSAKKFPHIRTMDNLDINVVGHTHHMTQEFVEVEQKCTRHFGKEKKSFDETAELFSSDTILLTAQPDIPT